MARRWKVKRKQNKKKKRNKNKMNNSISQSDPLSGASIYILTEEANEQAHDMAAFIAALGGDVAMSPLNATHALWVPTGEQDADVVTVTSYVEQAVVKCQSLGIPVLDSTWLERMSGLSESEHWSEIDVGSYVPPLVAMLDVGSNGKIETKKKQTKRKRGRDGPSRLGRSISETFAYLTKEEPDQMEEDSIRRAMELSMLDCALVFRRSGSSDLPFSSSGKQASKKRLVSPHEILGVDETATPAEIKSAYRKLALKKHPDKGGSADEFSAIARAYRSLLHTSHDDMSDIITNLKSTAHWDSELQDHQRLVEDLFLHHGANLEVNATKQADVIGSLGLVAKDIGMYTFNEKDERIGNSCFYLSLASSYLSGIGALASSDSSDEEDDCDGDEWALREADKALTGETALQLKRIIEAAVVSAHPEWAFQGKVGEEVQAFSDFLVYTLDSPTLLSDWAVAIFDTTSGFVDLYKGKNYSSIATNNEEWAQSNTLTLMYVPGHYKPLLPLDTSMRPTLERVLATLDKSEVFYVVTDGAA